jgi:hypothetical protein
VNLGTSAAAPGLVTSSSFGPIDGESYSFSGSGTGEYLGTTGVSESPFNGGGNTQQYYVEAQPGGTVTVTFSQPQTQLDLLWGSLDIGEEGVLNLISTNGTPVDTISGTNVCTQTGICSGTAWVSISGLASFNTITLQDPGGSPAFELDLGVPVSEAGTLGMLGAGLIGLIALGGFRRRNLVSC